MLKVGIIGCGFMGEMHANCYKALNNVNVVAVADIRKEQTENLAKISNAKIYDDGYELIVKEKLDIIDICLPTYLHTRYALKAMEKVKYLFIEKPVALTAEEGDLLLEQAKSSGCNVQVGQVIRFWDEYVALKKIIDAQKYGKITSANFSRISPRPTWSWENWYQDSALSGGAAQDLHIHDVDYVLSLFGVPEKIASVKNALGETKSYINTLMQYDDFPVNVEGAWNLPMTFPFSATFRIAFEKAAVSLSGGKLTVYTDDKTEQVVIEKEKLDGDFSGGNISDLGGYFNELKYFCEVASKGTTIEKATLKDGVSSLKFVLGEINQNA